MRQRLEEKRVSQSCDATATKNWQSGADGGISKWLALKGVRN